VRHARAQHCRVDFALAAGSVTLLIRDSRQAAAPPTGGPPPLPPAEGQGIAGMRQRLAEVGGTLALQFSPEGGTLLARVPLPAALDSGSAA
jgi:two-component system, NarL family, sensor histidine kinase DesK